MILIYFWPSTSLKYSACSDVSIVLPCVKYCIFMCIFTSEQTLCLSLNVVVRLSVSATCVFFCRCLIYSLAQIRLAAWLTFTLCYFFLSVSACVDVMWKKSALSTASRGLIRGTPAVDTRSCLTYTVWVLQRGKTVRRRSKVQQAFPWMQQYAYSLSVFCPKSSFFTVYNAQLRCKSMLENYPLVIMPFLACYPYLV